MTMNVHHKQLGLTLVEIMIAMVLGILLMGAVITIFTTTVKSSVENIRMVHLNQELRMLMGLISDELKRAGYSGDPNNHDFRNALNWDPGSNCLRYAYDVNGDGTLDPNDESFAFQYLPDAAIIRWGRGVTSETAPMAIGKRSPIQRRQQ
jgi:Tfp pilus assembly protein PilW